MEVVDHPTGGEHEGIVRVGQFLRRMVLRAFQNGTAARIVGLVRLAINLGARDQVVPVGLAHDVIGGEVVVFVKTPSPVRMRLIARPLDP